jgi:hypothetical protein
MGVCVAVLRGNREIDPKHLSDISICSIYQIYLEDNNFKAIDTHTCPRKKDEIRTSDGRRDTDADFGKKVYRGQREDGTPWEKIVSWFATSCTFLSMRTMNYP